MVLFTALVFHISSNLKLLQVHGTPILLLNSSFFYQLQLLCTEYQLELDNTYTKTSLSLSMCVYVCVCKTHSLQQRPRLTRNALHGDITDRHCVTVRRARLYSSL